MPITRSVWIDDDGTGTTGTPLNNAELQKIYNNIDSALVGGSGITTNVVTTALTGTAHNLACGAASLHTLIICTNTAELTITGLAFTTAPRVGDVVSIQLAGTGNVLLPHAHSGSTRKFRNYVTSAPVPLSGLFGRATYIYDHQGYFSLHSHEQGAWITPPFNASDYYGLVGMTWSVQSAGVTQCAYRLSGRTLTWFLHLSGSQLGGTPSGYLIRNVPAGFSVVTATPSPVGVYMHAPPTTYGIAQPYSATQINFIRDVAYTAWPIGGNLHLTANITNIVT